MKVWLVYFWIFKEKLKTMSKWEKKWFKCEFDRSKHQWRPKNKFSFNNMLYFIKKISLLEYLKSVKLPTEYSSNISKNISIKELKLIGMKSYNYHVLLIQLLPVVIRLQMLDTSLSSCISFFNSICSKVVEPVMLKKLQEDVVVTIY
jgi:hypothetical protein